MMHPIFIQKGCLKCHGHQGYKVGDERGGLRVSLDLTEHEAELLHAILIMSLAHLALWMVGAGLLSSSWRLRKKRTLALMQKTTDLLENEKQLIETAKEAESANEAKNRFLANMSHEIRTPMNAVLGYSNLLSMEVNDPEQSKYLQIIKSTGQSMVNLLNDILLATQLESGHLELNLQPLVVGEVMKEMSGMFQLEAEKKSLDLIFEEDDSIPKLLMLDSLRIHQVLLSMIGNAIKFTEQGFVRVSIRQIQRQENSVDLCFEIEDSGIGIDLSEQEMIFENFKQHIHDQNKILYGGVGLGLSIANRLLHLMNCQLELTSEPGQGSRFSFTLKEIPIASDRA